MAQHVRFVAANTFSPNKHATGIIVVVIVVVMLLSYTKHTHTYS